MLWEGNVLGRIGRRLYLSVREEGPVQTFRRISIASGRLLQAGKKDAFDTSLGIETSRIVPLWLLNIKSRNGKFGVRYQTIDPQAFHNAAALVPLAPSDFTFIDMGCGKGRMLILAAQKKFKRIIGIEFSPKLAAQARKNVNRVRVPAAVVEMDACEYVFPDDNLLIYMYNPFLGPVVNSVIQNLLQWRKNHTQKAFVLYLNPVCCERFECLPDFESVVSREGLRIWRLR